MAASMSSGNAESIRKPAVAGAFYPDDDAQLRREIQGYLHAVPPQKVHDVRMLISPHAGYVYSGPVAAFGYRCLDKNVETVIILGPSHRAMFSGIAIPAADQYATPLGNVPMARALIANLAKNSLVHVNDSADTQEHSVEVQVPFLQVVLDKGFTLVPIVTGNVDPAQVAELLLPYINDKTAVIASSDLSHYLASNDAKALDRATINTVVSQDPTGVLEACGEIPIRIVMLLARKLGLQPDLLDARNSYQTAPRYGSADRVVGYASIAFIKNGMPQRSNVAHRQTTLGAPAGLPSEVEHFLLTLARASLEAAVNGKALAAPENIPEIAKENRGCFVTLTQNGSLRGCIGTIEPIKPLYRGVIDNAQNSGLRDPRFTPMTGAELSRTKIEISVLTPPEPLAYSSPQDLLNKIVQGQDGIILQKGRHQSTYLPQVWEQLPDKVDFLENLALKGGMEADGWKTATVKRYRALHFEEP